MNDKIDSYQHLIHINTTTQSVCRYLSMSLFLRHHAYIRSVGNVLDLVGLRIIANLHAGRRWNNGYSINGILYKAFWKVVKSGYIVVIDNGYRKGKRIELTDKGKRIIEDLTQIEREYIRELMAAELEG